MIYDFCKLVNFIAFYIIQKKNEFAKYFKYFFWQFFDITIIEKNEYFIYQQRNDNQIWIIKFSNENDFVMNNRWIISYNFYFIRRYQIHINVKICVIVKIVKYIHKYIYKNDDQIILQINKNNKIFWHINDRYINFLQIVWKLIKYFVHNE